VTRRKYDNTTGYLTLEPGYAFVWNIDENKIEILGSIQDPRYSPRASSTRISLEIYDPNIKMPDGSISTNHAFAQLVVARL
jgi:hypothetical protein